MKKVKTVKILVAAPKPRHHQMLFSCNMPFWPQKQASKVQYQRHSKHRNCSAEQNG
jgi:hypothetical protein